MDWDALSPVPCHLLVPHATTPLRFLASGSLAALEPAYVAALRAPDAADWAAVRAFAQQQIRISARVEAGERAVVERSPIAISDVAASVDAAVIAQPDARISDSGIRVEGVAPPPVQPSNPPTQPRSINIGVAAGAGGAVDGSPASYIEHADSVNLQLPDPAAQQRADDLLAFLRRTLHDCNALPLGKIDQTDATHARPMELARVYIALNTTNTVKNERVGMSIERRPDQRPLSMVEALSHAKDGRAMLLGAPGSGKSTFASHLTYCLASATLTRLNGNASDAGLAQLPGWRYGPLLPVPIVLRDLAAFPAVAAARQGSVRLIGDFLAARAAELGCPQSAVPLLAALRKGKALLVLDGLDEVVGEAVLPRVAEAIIDAAKTFPGPILVTCRALDYQEERARQLPGFVTYTLADLTPEQIDAFIGAWYAELADSGRRSASQAADDAREMQGAVQSRDELRELAGTPLLLTLMAQVHAFRGTLPDARALLYFSCIELLLLRWRQPRDEPDLIEQLGLSRFRSSDLLALMARLGYEAHSRAERSADVRGSADLDEATLVTVLADVFEAYDPARKFALAGSVLRALAYGNGLLLQRGPKLYTFAHRTFQEFLAGYHLKGQRNAQQLCREHAAQLHWHEALLLMVGYQVLGENELEKPIGLAEKLLAASPLEQALAGDVLALVGRERARSFDPALVAAGGLWPTAIRTLRALQSRGQAPAVPASLRHRMGLALGRLCYGELKDLTLPGARPPTADPRLPFAVVGLGYSDAWRCALDEHYWCAIAPGPFWSGDDREEKLKRAKIDQPYRIARYPITNADYARFLAANGPDGYDPARPWWTEHGRTYLLPGGRRYSGEPEQITRPRFWSVARYNGALQPAVGVSWYEAAAYCRWLTAEGHGVGWLPAGDVIRLPTWHEWERAARHTDQRPYPWGNEPLTAERASYGETGLAAPSPIGSFPAGAAVSGAQDMLGNVLEWTASPWEKWEQWRKDFTRISSVTISFTYFHDSTNELKCGARYRNYPSNGDYNGGFRVTQSRALTE